MKNAFLPTLVAAAASGFTENEIPGLHQATSKSKSSRPIVGEVPTNSEWYCSKSVDRLQGGFTDLGEYLNTNQDFTDETFAPEGDQVIWWDGFNSYNQFWYYSDYLETGYLSFERFTDQWPDISVMDADGSIDWTDINQGGAGTCYIKAAMASIGEFPDLVRATFVNQETNENGIYNIRFFIRGKPWIVTIDDYLLFYDTEPTSLVFSAQSSDNNAIWGALLEKAWAKVKGNYLISEGGMTANGIRALTGVPVFDYYSAEFSVDSYSQNMMWELLVEAEEKHYIMGAGTAGAGDDSMYNDCGVAMSHAYSLISAFTMTDASGTEHRCLLIRNPWGMNGYSWTWSRNDPNWTQDLIDQVPHGFDPLNSDSDSTGLFVVPFEAFSNNADVGYCFVDIQIGHNRESEGYEDRWYDVIDASEEQYEFSYTASTNDMPVYFTVETYSFNIVPYTCTMAYDSDTEQYADTPIVLLDIYYGAENPWEYYMDYQHRPIMVDNYSLEQFRILVKYSWYGSPRKDFTLKVYSVDHNEVYDSAGGTNMLHTDGQEPSEFDYISENFPDGRVADDEPVNDENRFNDDYTGCTDTNLGSTDSYGDGCEWYVYNQQYCGQFDTSTFLASTMCCSCNGGCFDTAGEETDSNDYGCEYYNSLPTECGLYDSTTFNATEMCCACQVFEDYSDYYDEQEEEESYSCSCMAYDTTNEDYCTSSTMDQETCVSDTSCYWGPAYYSECYADNFDCEDTSNGATDSGNDGCEWYWDYQSQCGHYDTEDFSAVDMCCACQGDAIDIHRELTCSCFALDESSTEGSHCSDDSMDLYNCMEDHSCYWGPYYDSYCVEQNYFYDETEECKCYGHDYGYENIDTSYCENADVDSCLTDDYCYLGPWDNYHCSDQNHYYYYDDDDYDYDYDYVTCQCFANSDSVEDYEYCETTDLLYDVEGCVQDSRCHWGPDDIYECGYYNNDYYYDDYTYDYTEDCSCHAHDSSDDWYCNSTVVDMDNCIYDQSCYWGPWENSTCANENYYYGDDSCYCTGYDTTSDCGWYGFDSCVFSSECYWDGDESCQESAHEAFIGLYENFWYGEDSNSYHFVEIIVDSSGQMWWINDAGLEWTLYYEWEHHVLYTGSDCVYGDQDLEIGVDGELWFLDEPYYPVNSHSNEGEDGDDALCKDSAEGHTDSYGDGCEWYDYVPTDCGFYDTNFFFANEMCCACSGGTATEEEEEEEEDVVIIDDISCYDTNSGETDVYGDGCEWYYEYPSSCGMGDNGTFSAYDMCCACGGGRASEEAICEDSAGYAKDVDGFGCGWYNSNPQDCGHYDDSDFRANDMCCGCGGGGGDYFDPTTAEVTSLQDVLAQADTAADVLLAILHNPWVLFVWFDWSEYAI